MYEALYVIAKLTYEVQLPPARSHLLAQGGRYFLVHAYCIRGERFYPLTHRMRRTTAPSPLLLIHASAVLVPTTCGFNCSSRAKPAITGRGR